MTQSAFTHKGNGVLSQLITDVTISSGNNRETVSGLWDTGASGTCIALSVVDKLGISPIQKIEQQTPAGKRIAGVYIVDIVLPNNVQFANHVVCDAELDEQGIQMLVGMDIISSGTLTVSTFKGRTFFSFVHPSSQHVDYVYQLSIKKITDKGHMKKKKIALCDM